MLASGAHISIDGTEFFLDDSVEDHYVWKYSDPQTFFSTQEGQAFGQRDEFYHQIRYWYMEDWRGGEGMQIMSNDIDTDQYDQGQLHGRIAGLLLPPPTILSTQTFTPKVRSGQNAMKSLKMVHGGGNVWAFAEQEGWYSPDPTLPVINWQHIAAADIIGGLPQINNNTWTITAICGDMDFVYLAVSDANNGNPPLVGNNGNVGIIRIDPNGTITTIFSNKAMATNIPPYAGIAIQQNILFAWTGWALYMFDVSQAPSGGWPINPPSTSSTATGGYNTATYLNGVIQGVNLVRAGILELGTDMTGGDTDVYCMVSEGNRTTIYEASALANVPLHSIWEMPAGFTGQSLCFTNGLLFISGNYFGRAGIFVMSTGTSYQSSFLAWIRYWGPGGNVLSSGAGVGSEVYFVHSTAGIFVYDYNTNGLSRLDGAASDGGDLDLSSLGGKAQITTFQGKRVLAFQSSNTGFTVQTRDHDTNPKNAVNLVHYTPTNTFGYTRYVKTLLGLDLQFKPLTASDSIKVEYCTDEAGGFYKTWPSTPSSGTWVLANDPTYGGTVSGAGLTRAWLDLTALNVRFRRIRWRLTVNGAPQVVALAATAWIGPGQEVLQLIVRVRDEKDEASNQNRRRPANRQARAEDLRIVLRKHARSKNVITVKDGYPYRQKGPGFFDTYEMVMEEMEERIAINAQGTFQVSLRRVDDSALI